MFDRNLSSWPARCRAVPFLAGLSLASLAGAAHSSSGSQIASGSSGTAGFGVSIDLDGELAVIGAPGSFTAPGSVVVLGHAGEEWVELAVIDPLPGAVLHGFGQAVALSGERLAVGAPLAPALFASAAGRVYVYDRQPDGAWHLSASLAAEVPMTAGLFGSALALDGDRLVVGEPGADRAWAFHFDSDSWSLAAELPDPSDAGDEFGASVALAGNVALVGSPGRDYGGVDGGAVYGFFESGGTWLFEEGLYPDSPQAGSRFGASLAVDGLVALIGAPGRAVGGLTAAGEVVTMERHPLGGWQQTDVRAADMPMAGARFGSAVDLDDAFAVVGAPGNIGAGSAHVFRQPNSGGLDLLDVVTGSESEDGDLFGAAVVLAGNAVLIGAPGPGEATLYTLPDLLGSADELSVLLGGTQQMLLNAGAHHAGDVYLVLGTASGTSPGTWFDGHAIPLNVDLYTVMTLTSPAKGIVSGSLGVLDACGRGGATLELPPGAFPSLAGTELHHAYLLFDVGVPIPSTSYASSALGLSLTDNVVQKP